MKYRIIEEENQLIIITEDDERIRDDTIFLDLLPIARYPSFKG